MAPSQLDGPHNRERAADGKSAFPRASRNDARAGSSTQIRSGHVGCGNVKPFLVVTVKTAQGGKTLLGAFRLGSFLKHLL